MHSPLATFRQDRAALRSAEALIGPDAAGTLPLEVITVREQVVFDGQLAAVAERIRSRIKGAYVETGRDLLAVKDRLSGNFGKWLAAEFGMSERTAERYMEVARLAVRSDKIVGLPPQVIYALASAPETVRDCMVKRVVDGEPIRARDVREAASEVRHTAKREKEIADRRIWESKRRKSGKKRQEAEERQNRERELRQAEADKAVEELVALLRDKVDSNGLIRLLDTIEAGSFFSLYQLADRLRERGAA